MSANNPDHLPSGELRHFSTPPRTGAGYDPNNNSGDVIIPARLPPGKITIGFQHTTDIGAQVCRDTARPLPIVIEQHRGLPPDDVRLASSKPPATLLKYDFSQRKPHTLLYFKCHTQKIMQLQRLAHKLFFQQLGITKRIFTHSIINNQ